MNHRSDPVRDRRQEPSPSRPKTADPSRAGARRRTFRAGELLRGITFGGSAFLLGSCSLLFGAAPLGLALLAAGSAYTWYILTGLLLAAAFAPVTPGGWVWAGVYLFCVTLRLVVRFFVDPPAFPDGRPCGGRTYLLLCWVSFKRNIGLIPDEPASAWDAAADYYAGHDRTAPSEERGNTERSRASSIADKLPHYGLWDEASGRFEPRLFSEHPLLRMLTAAVCGFVAGLFGMIAGGFHVYDLLATLVFIVVTPVAAFLFVSCFGEAGLTLLFSPEPLKAMPLREKYGGRERSRALHNKSDRVVPGLRARFAVLPLLSVVSFLVAVTFAARTFAIPLGSPYLTVEVAVLLALVLTLFASSRLGVVPGVAVATLCGLAADPQVAPLCILCAGGYALLRYISHRTGILAGCTVGAIWCAAVEGAAALVNRLPAILLTIPVFLVVEKLCNTLPAGEKTPTEDEELRDFTSMLASALVAETRADAQRAKLKALSEAFGALSRRFYHLSSQFKQPRMMELRRLCDEAFGKQCARCRKRDECWGAAYGRTVEIQTRLASRLHTGGRAESEVLPDDLRDFCPHLETIIEDINSRYARMTAHLMRNEKTEAFASDYEAIAALLGDALEEDSLTEEEYRHNRVAADRIYDYLTAEGVTVLGVAVCGKRSHRRQHIIVRGRGLEQLEDHATEVRDRLEDICGTRLTLPAFKHEDGSPSTEMTLCSEPQLDTVYAGSTVPATAAEGKTKVDKRPADSLPPPLTDETPAGSYSPPAVCGDHIALFKTDNAYFYALISDGMGSGEDASLTSDICTMFLEKMLAAGNRVEISLRMLSSYICSKNSGTGDECTATVDLMELDLMDGHAVFAKNGAAPTYVVRDGTVYKLRSRTMPIGILQDTSPQLLRFRMHPGDVVVMVSDGVTLGNDECPWLIDLLSSPIPESMDSLRSDILRRAISSGSPDDLSAIAIRVEATGE